MGNRVKYDVDAEWDDPFERKAERRGALRYPSKFKVSVTVDGTTAGRSMTGPGLVKDVSLTGLRFLTKHQLGKGQDVSLAMPTDLCPETMGLPEAFRGPAKVVRVRDVDERRRMAALKFGDAFSMNMEFAVFMEYLRSISTVARAS